MKLLREYIRGLIAERLVDLTDMEDPNEKLQPQFDAFMAEYESLSERNPIGAPGDRYWYMGKQGEAHCIVITNMRPWDGHIHFSSISTAPPDVCEGKGYASKVMNQLVALADKHGVPMSLDPKPFGKKTLGVKELKGWYRRVGFKPSKKSGKWKRPAQ